MIHFVSGLPRSGSTLLMNLLAQNPRHIVTPTSGLIDLVVGLRGGWMNSPSLRAEGLEVVQPKVERAIKGMIESYHGVKDEDRARTAFDKNRGWVAYIELLEKALGRRVQVILTIRDVRAVLASFERLHRSNPTLRLEPKGPAFFQAQTVEGRCQMLLSSSGAVGICINRIRDAINRGLGDRLIIVPYARLIREPKAVLAALHDELELPFFDGYDPDHVEQVTKEDDMLWGWSGLHVVRSKVEAPAHAPWDGVLPPTYANKIASEYGDFAAA